MFTFHSLYPFYPPPHLQWVIVTSMTRFCSLLDFGHLFLSLWQQLICPNLPHSQAIFVKASKFIIFLQKSFLGNFYRHLAIFSGHRHFVKNLIANLQISIHELCQCFNFILSILIIQLVSKYNSLSLMYIEPQQKSQLVLTNQDKVVRLV